MQLHVNATIEKKVFLPIFFKKKSLQKFSINRLHCIWLAGYSVNIRVRLDSLRKQCDVRHMIVFYLSNRQMTLICFILSDVYLNNKKFKIISVICPWIY